MISGLGRIAFAQKSYSEALEHFNKALLLSKEMNNQEMQPDLLNVIARATLAKNKKIEARNYLYDALKHALELGTTSKLIDSIAGLAELAIADNKFEVALELLLQIKEHTSTEAKTADWIENMYQSVKHASSPDKLQTMPLKDYARELLKQTAF